MNCLFLASSFPGFLSGFSSSGPIAEELLQDLVQILGDLHLVVEEVLEPGVFEALGHRQQREQVAEAHADGPGHGGGRLGRVEQAKMGWHSITSRRSRDRAPWRCAAGTFPAVA